MSKAFYIAGSSMLNGSISGIDVVEESRLYNLNDYITSGKANNLATNENGILLGKGVADKLALTLGDKIQLRTTAGDNFTLKIVGLFQSGMADVDNIQSYVNLKTAQRLLGETNDYITDINIKLYNMSKAPEIGRDMERKYDITATDIQTANAQFETGTSIRNLISYAVSITLLIVAGFGIYNILNMLIY